MGYTVVAEVCILMYLPVVSCSLDLWNLMGGLIVGIDHSPCRIIRGKEFSALSCYARIGLC